MTMCAFNLGQSVTRLPRSVQCGLRTHNLHKCLELAAKALLKSAGRARGAGGGLVALMSLHRCGPRQASAPFKVCRVRGLERSHRHDCRMVALVVQASRGYLVQAPTLQRCLVAFPGHQLRRKEQGLRVTSRQLAWC